MKVIFLDIDGVLNSRPFLEDVCDRGLPWGCDHISTPMIQLLDTLCRNTGADIVISSSWRDIEPFDTLSAWLKWHGLSARVIGKTPYLNGQPRGREISQWLEDNRNLPIESFVILDDTDDMEGVEDRFVHTEWELGLTQEDVEDAEAILNSPRACVPHSGT